MVLDLCFDPIDLVRRHIRIKHEYENKLSEDQKRRARRDHHSKRKPRHCGLTVHLTVGGCPFRCVYCYTYDMGFDSNPRPNPLTPEELVYALLSNQHFISGRYGTLIAIGSVSEPFIYPDKAMSYLREMARLGNPIQFSTKSYISKSYANDIAKLGAPINPLVTIITTRLEDLLEPYAPSVDKRLETIENLSSAGLRVCLFLRPIIVGVNYSEAKEIMLLARESGAQCVIIGSFRITYRIYQLLRSLGLDLSEIERRINIKVLNRKPKKQIAVPLTAKEKNELISLARSLGLVPFKSACCANSNNAGVICPSICFETNFCTGCPNRCWEKPRPNLSSIRAALKLLGIDVKIGIKNGKIYVSRHGHDPVIQLLARRLIEH